MGFRSRLGAAWREFKNAGSPLDGTLALFREVFGREPAKSGQRVTIDTALSVATMFAGLRVIAEGIAQSPCDVFQDRAQGGGKDIATDNDLYALLTVAPNDLQTPFEFFETLIFHCGLCFNFYAFKSTVRGKLDELIPLDPGRVTVKQNADLTLTYKVRGVDGQSRDFPQELIWHVRGPSWNSWLGMDFLKIAREAVGLTMAIEADQAHLYKNGLRTSGTYSVEGKLNPEQYKDLRQYIKDYQADEGGGPLILDMAAKYLNETMTGVDAQTLESRKLQIEEICRLLRVMPIMVGHAGNTSPTFASAEQFFIAHVVHTLLPWARRIETSINKNLIGREKVIGGLRAKFNLNALMRGSFAERQKSFAQMLGLGGSPPWAEVNEVRELDDMNPVDWGSGKPVPAVAPKPAADNPADPPKD
jgi:HK97 family phage portal protein